MAFEVEKKGSVFGDERRFVYRWVVAGRMVKSEALLSAERNKKTARGCCS